MERNPVLVVMAAGMGSRYGGLKQIDPVGSHGEALLDFSIYDAYQAGFRTTVIIIKEAIKKDFMELVAPRLEKSPMEIKYAFQELDKLPEGFSVPAGRTKPWGTTHAVLCARDVIGDNPFVVLNADDFYGRTAFRAAYNWLKNNDKPFSYCMVGYEVGKTVTENGGVTRGICEFDRFGYLSKIVECRNIEKHGRDVRLPKSDGTWFILPPEHPVSMNMWGFQPDFLDTIAGRFPNFMTNVVPGDPMKAEWLLPTTVDYLVESGKCSVKVLTSPDNWYGVTYAGDKPKVVEALRRLTEDGLYPDGLWEQ